MDKIRGNAYIKSRPTLYNRAICDYSQDNQKKPQNKLATTFTDVWQWVIAIGGPTLPDTTVGVLTIPLKGNLYSSTLVYSKVCAQGQHPLFPIVEY